MSKDSGIVDPCVVPSGVRKLFPVGVDTSTNRSRGPHHVGRFIPIWRKVHGFCDIVGPAKVEAMMIGVTQGLGPTAGGSTTFPRIPKGVVRRIVVDG